MHSIKDAARNDARDLRALGKSLRAISDAVSATHRFYVSHITVRKWCRDIQPPKAA